MLEISTFGYGTCIHAPAQNLVSNMPPTLAQYHAYHSMVCSPSTARQCGDSFQTSGGTIIFMPAGTVPALSDSTTTLNVLTYYLLVVISFTGLSTLLGMTDFVDAREMDEKDQAVVIACGTENEKDEEITLSPLMRSVRDPTNVTLSIDALRYVAKQSSVDELSELRIIRRFEYDFRLVGVNVIMIHLMSPAKVEGRPRPLHLIEVYQFRNPILRFISWVILGCFQLIWPSIESLLELAGLGNTASCTTRSGSQKKA